MVRRMDLKSCLSQFKDYTELRIQDNRTRNLTLANGNMMDNSFNSKSGLSARVYKRGAWGFASDPVMNDDTVRTVIAKATENANFLDSRKHLGLSELPSRPGTSDNDLTSKKQPVSYKEQVEFAREFEAYMRKKKDVVSSVVVLNTLEMEKQLVTSEGSHTFSMLPRVLMYFTMTIKKNNETIELMESLGGLGQFQDYFGDIDKLYPRIDKLHEDLLMKADGIFPQSGVHDVILDARLAGVLAHEAIGHTVEADMVLGGSVAAHYLGKEIASPIVNMVDFAHTAQGVQCPVPVFIDDEGVEAKDAVLIENGVLKSFLHNKASAMRFETEPTGNARAYNYDDEPLIRMRNTAFLPGKSKLEDMIASIEHGYYFTRFSNGQADSTSEFMFGIPSGYEITGGKLGRAIRDTTIAGVAFEMLKTVTMISDDMSWSNEGMCGKKQMIPVGMGGPAIKCQINIGGR